MPKTIVGLCAATLLGLSSVARAEQFVLVDVSYTHSAQTTSDSHYYVTLPANTPKDWTSPVDYSKGSVHIIVDVKTKPAGDAPTKIQLCFEGTPSYGCSVQSPTYTKVGRVEWDSPFSQFWYESTVDWSKGIKKLPIILKDDKNNKPAGDPKYMPSDLYVQATLVSAGAKFVAPPAAGGGGAAGAAAGAGGTAAGAGGAGTSGAGGAGRSGSGGTPSVAGSGAGNTGSAGAAARSGGSAGSSNAAGSGTSSGAAVRTAGSSAVDIAGAAAPGQAGAGGAPASDATQAEDRSTSSDSGCRAAAAGSNEAAWLVVFAFLWLRRRATRRRS